MRNLLAEWDAATPDNPMVIASDIIDEFTRLLSKRNAAPPVRNFYVQSDYMPSGALKSMADGKTYDSKSQYYRSIKNAGLVVMGNDKPNKTEANEVTGRDIKDAIERIRAS